MGFAAKALARFEGKPEPESVPTANRAARRLADRNFKFTITYADGEVKTLDCGMNKVQAYRAWFRKNQPTAKVVVEEVQTFATSDGKTYQKLTFTAQPKLAHAEGGTYMKVNATDKVASTHDCVHAPIDSVPLAWVDNRPIVKASDRAAKVKAERLRNAMLARSVEEDRKIRIYDNFTSKLIFCSDNLEAFVSFMNRGTYSKAKYTIYLPAFLQAMVDKKIIANRKAK